MHDVQDADAARRVVLKDAYADADQIAVALVHQLLHFLGGVVNRVFIAERVHIAVQHILHCQFIIDRADEVGAHICVHLQQLVKIDAAFALFATDDIVAQLGLIGRTQQHERGHKRDQTREKDDQQHRCQA